MKIHRKKKSFPPMSGVVSRSIRAGEMREGCVRGDCVHVLGGREAGEHRARPRKAEKGREGADHVLPIKYFLLNG